MAAKTVQINVRVVPEVAERLERLKGIVSEALGLSTVSQPDLIEMGLALLEEFYTARRAERPAAVATLIGHEMPQPKEPEVAPVKRPRGRPRKTPAT